MMKKLKLAILWLLGYRYKLCRYVGRSENKTLSLDYIPLMFEILPLFSKPNERRMTYTVPDDQNSYNKIVFTPLDFLDEKVYFNFPGVLHLTKQEKPLMLINRCKGNFESSIIFFGGYSRTVRMKPDNLD